MELALGVGAYVLYLRYLDAWMYFCIVLGLLVFVYLVINRPVIPGAVMAEVDGEGVSLPSVPFLGYSELRSCFVVKDGRFSDIAVIAEDSYLEKLGGKQRETAEENFAEYGYHYITSVRSRPILKSEIAKLLATVENNSAVYHLGRVEKAEGCDYEKLDSGLPLVTLEDEYFYFLSDCVLVSLMGSDPIVRFKLDGLKAVGGVVSMAGSVRVFSLLFYFDDAVLKVNDSLKGFGKLYEYVSSLPDLDSKKLIQSLGSPGNTPVIYWRAGTVESRE